MTDIIADNKSFEDGAAYGIITIDDGDKNVGYASGPWKPQDALLLGINEGLDSAKSHARVYLRKPQIANYAKLDYIEEWRMSGWKTMSGSKVTPKEQWKRLLNHTKEKDIEWHGNSDHELLGWARRAALCAVAEVSIHSLRPLEDVETVSTEKAQHFWMNVNASGFTERGARKLLSDFGVVSAKDIPASEWESVRERATSEVIAERYQR